MKIPTPPVSALLLALAAVLLGGCSSTQLTRVQPWERGVLAGKIMDPKRAPLDTAFGEHIYFSRESTAGGAGVGGSGCGCN